MGGMGMNHEEYYWLICYRKPRRSFKWGTSYHLSQMKYPPRPVLPYYGTIDYKKRVKYRRLLTFRKGLALTSIVSMTDFSQISYVRHMYYVGDL